MAINKAEGEILLLGDLNSHHLAWGGTHVAIEAQGERLLHDTTAQNLYLATPRGEPTWKRGHLKSVINLTFALAELYNRISFCRLEDR